jgi:RimJ/RimL family protein N-acetyltransferase
MAGLPEQIDAGDGLVLRRWTAALVDDLAASIADNVDHLRGYMLWIAAEPLPRSERLALIATWEEQWRAGTDVVFGMWLDGEVVGGCGLHDRVGPGGTEIGYWVSHRHLGQGLARRASAALTTAALGAAGVDFVEIHHNETNRYSATVPPALGYRRVGEVRIERTLAPAEGPIEVCWRVTRAEWLAR